MSLQIVQLGHPVLRKKAKTVADLQDQKVQKLIKDWEGCLSVPGIRNLFPKKNIRNF